jgi:hypothetical protein
MPDDDTAGASADAFELVLGTPQPTQYCLSAAKLRGVLDWFDVDDPAYDPLPVAKDPQADQWLLLDGHTRAVSALLAGERSLRVRDATDDPDVDLAVYRTCREWCRERGVRSVWDLVGETWSAQRYEDEWLGRCERELAED